MAFHEPELWRYFFRDSTWKSGGWTDNFMACVCLNLHLYSVAATTASV
jgi:hypothetical protein